MKLRSYHLLLFWVGGWLFVSNFQFGGLDRPSYLTQGIIIIGLLTYLVGTCLIPLPKTKFPEIILTSELRKDTQKIKLFYWFSIIPLIIVYVYLCVKAIGVFTNADTLAIRGMLLGLDGETSVLMPSKQIHLLYDLIIVTLLRVNIIFAFYLFIYSEKKLPLLISNCLLAVSSIIFLGRGFLLEFGFQIIFYFIIKREQQKKVSNRFRIFFLSSIGAMFVIGAVMGALRGDSDDSNLKKFLKYQIVNYHTVGFVILDQELNDSFSRLNQTLGVGRATLGGLERITVLLIRRFDKSVDSAPGQNTEDLAQFRTVGNSEGIALKYNAFGTLFYTFLFDGGILFLIVGFFWLGILIKVLNNKHFSGRTYYMCYVYLFTHLMVQSLYYSPIETSSFWLSFFLLIIIHNTPTHWRQAKLRKSQWKKV